MVTACARRVVTFLTIPGYITMLAEFFQARLYFSFHPNLRQALTRLNMASMQHNANANCILIRCFILWTENFIAELPFRAFQNLYKMKTASTSFGFYYFQGY